MLGGGGKEKSRTGEWGAREAERGGVGGVFPCRHPLNHSHTRATPKKQTVG